MESLAENRFWDQLLNLIGEGYVVPVVGPDLLKIRHQDCEVHLYALIARRLAEYIGVSGKDLPENDEINTVVCRYIEKGNRIEDIYSALKIVMPPDDEIPIPEPLNKLAEISPFKLFVTITFDNLLERAINGVRFAGQQKTKVFSYTPNYVEDLPRSIEKLEGPAVFHLFGRLSAIPAYAVTQEDTLEFLHSLQSDNRQPHILFDELNRTNLLILGCSFGDWLARFFIRTAKRQRLSEARGTTDFVADARISADDKLVYFLRHFSTRTKIYRDGGAFDFIDELHQRWHAHDHLSGFDLAERQTSLSTVAHIKPGIVFLSYASEDRDAVIRIRDALESEGIDVFFDKDALRAGDNFEVNLKQSITECALFIPVISQSTLTKQRRFFRIEWKQAIDEARKVSPTERFIVPVVIDDTSPKESAVEDYFRGLHWVQLSKGQVTPDFVAMVKRLYRRYQKIVMGAL